MGGNEDISGNFKISYEGVHIPLYCLYLQIGLGSFN